MSKLIIFLMLILYGCGGVNNIDSFRYNACLDLYCSNSEESISKQAGLKLVEIAASAYNIQIDLERGICEDIYSKRDINYIYAVRDMEEVCHEGSIDKDGN